MKIRTARLLALSALSLALAACDNLPAPLAKLFGQETAPASAVQTASAPASAPAAASAPASVREAFTSACLNAAAQQSAADAAIVQYCDCVYDEGVKAYGDKAQWDSALAIDKPENMPERLKTTVAAVSDACSKKVFDAPAASAAAASSAPPAPAASAPVPAAARASAPSPAPASAAASALAAPAPASDASAPAAGEASAPAQKKSPHGKRRRHR